MRSSSEACTGSCRMHGASAGLQKRMQPGHGLQHQKVFPSAWSTHRQRNKTTASPLSQGYPHQHGPQSRCTGLRAWCLAQCCPTCTWPGSTSPSAPGSSRGHVSGPLRWLRQPAPCQTCTLWRSLLAAPQCAPSDQAHDLLQDFRKDVHVQSALFKHDQLMEQQSEHACALSATTS
jgi:hypothetical protein